MRFAYADPPYLGRCGRYDHNHPDGRCWDEPETHRLLVERLSQYDGWAMSLSAASLQIILPMCPPTVRTLAWVKPWASWKPGVFPAYAWEPVILSPATRKRKWQHGDADTPRDWLSHVAHQRGFFGSKPEAFTRWMLECLGVTAEDDFDDLFPGSGAVTRAYESWIAQLPMGISA